MLQELLSIFKPGNPLSQMADDFAEMLDLACRMTLDAGKIFFGNHLPAEARTQIYKRDVKVNKLERKIRKRVVTHIALGRHVSTIPYTLVLMSLVKDVERLGDYAKNLSEVSEIFRGDLPDDDIVGELREIRAGVDEAFQAAAEVFQQSDRERAIYLIREGKDYAHRCDMLLQRIAKSDYPSDLTTAVVLGVRYYKRIGGHLLNVLSSVVMPLHKIDFYDEDEVPAPVKPSN